MSHETAALNTTVTAQMHPLTPIAVNLGRAAVLGPVTLAGYCITDIHIAVSLCLILWKQRTGIVRTNWLVSRLVLYSINRGVVSVVLELAEFTALLAGISLRSTSYKLLWIVFHFVNSKVYVNSVLALLNARQHLRRGGSRGVESPSNGIQIHTFTYTSVV